MATETDIVRDIIHQLKQRGGDGYHVHGSSVQRTGEPDISGEWPVRDTETGDLVCYLHLKIEVKTPTGTPSRIQLYRLEQYVDRGYVAGIATCWDDVMHLIMEFMMEGSTRPSFTETFRKYRNVAS